MRMKRVRHRAAAVLASGLAGMCAALAQAPAPAGPPAPAPVPPQASAPAAAAPVPTAPRPYVVEYSYRVKWGHLEEFIRLFRKNQYPVLRRLRELGIVREIAIAYPINHANEPDRWDMRVTVTYRDANASLPDPAIDEAIMPALYPDKATFLREERQRFELLPAHIDVPMIVDHMRAWGTVAPAD